MPLAQLDQAACLRFDPEIWFDKSTKRRAIELCSACPVLVSCLRAADEIEQHEVYIFGVRGALTATRRANTRRHRMAARAS